MVSVPEAGNGDSTYVNRIAFAPDGGSCLTAHHDALIRKWDVETGRLLATLAGHAKVVWWVAFSPDGKWVASGSLDRTVRIWEAATGVEICRLTGHDAGVRDGAWGPGGRTLAAAAGSEVRVWSLRPDRPARAAIWRLCGTTWRRTL